MSLPPQTRVCPRHSRGVRFDEPRHEQEAALPVGLER